MKTSVTIWSSSRFPGEEKMERNTVFDSYGTLPSTAEDERLIRFIITCLYNLLSRIIYSVYLILFFFLLVSQLLLIFVVKWKRRNISLSLQLYFLRRRNILYLVRYLSFLLTISQSNRIFFIIFHHVTVVEYIHSVRNRNEDRLDSLGSFDCGKLGYGDEIARKDEEEAKKRRRERERRAKVQLGLLLNNK